MDACYWAPAKPRLIHRTIEDLDVVFDPVSSTSHFLTELHSAVLNAVPQAKQPALSVSDLVSVLSDQFEFEPGVDLSAAVLEALEHLVAANLLEEQTRH